MQTGDSKIPTQPAWADRFNQCLGNSPNSPNSLDNPDSPDNPDNSDNPDNLCGIIDLPESTEKYAQLVAISEDFVKTARMYCC